MKSSKLILAVLTSLIFCLAVGVVVGSPALGFSLFVIDLFAAGFIYRYRGFVPKDSLFSVCGAISAAILLDCVNVTVGGVDTTVYLANFSDITSVTRNGSNPQIIEAITMVATKKFYKYEGQNNSVEPEQHMVPLKYARVYEHVINQKIFTVTPTAKAQLELLVKGRVVAIIENNFRNGTTGNTAYEIYGLDVGLEVDHLDRILADQDTQGAYDLGLKTPEVGGKEGHLPAALFITDYAATKAVVAALIA